MARDTGPKGSDRQSRSIEAKANDAQTAGYPEEESRKAQYRTWVCEGRQTALDPICYRWHANTGFPINTGAGPEARGIRSRLIGTCWTR